MSTVASGYEFKKPIRDKVQNLNQYQHGSEILSGRGQRPFSLFQVFPFALPLSLSLCLPLCLSLCLPLCLPLPLSLSLSPSLSLSVRTSGTRVYVDQKTEDLWPTESGWSSAYRAITIWKILRNLHCHFKDPILVVSHSDENHCIPDWQKRKQNMFC